jgi:hypothetical protein
MQLLKIHRLLCKRYLLLKHFFLRMRRVERKGRLSRDELEKTRTIVHARRSCLKNKHVRGAVWIAPNNRRQVAMCKCAACGSLLEDRNLIA